ncbi:glutathione peroxidase [Flaviaesturariibacter flavus]|uniref:Glutathione peroxidase n=2 Tax=Flaviaesturariibacter flavus TaxID=2502780 RepID=A0A4R1BAL7_9BACT|nr:glutathione peroxidase [Flaviaesturariibacter flavus]
MKLLFLATLLTMITATGLYDFKVDGLSGGTIDLAQYKGKKILIVNTASECGYTPQYEGLEQLYKKYSDKLVVIGFPANNFGGQEPGSNEQIGAFCKKNYGVTFPMAAKVSVVGDDAHPLFRYLAEEARKQGVEGPVIKWNFTKFLIDENGKLVHVFPSKVAPMSEELTSYLK